MSSRRGVYLRPHVREMLLAYARETGLTPSKIVNIALESFLSSTALGDSLKKAMKVEVEREQLTREERRLFNELRVILRSGVHIGDAQRRLLLGMSSDEISRLRQSQGIYAQMNDSQRDAVMRIFDRRRAIADRLVEIERVVLPESKQTVGYGRYGELEIMPKASSSEFVTSYVKQSLEARGEATR